jgi:hypothetical protein
VGHIAGHHSARADDRIIFYDYAGQKDRPATDPHISSDSDGPAKLQAGVALLTITRMVRRVDLNCGPDLCAIIDRDRCNIENHAVEIQKHAFPDPDVVPVVAKERRFDNRPSPT